MSALNSGNLEDTAIAMAELKEAYGNLLDINGSSLSATFLESTENLELMKEAINGNEEAYEKLLDLANQDMSMNFGINPDQIENVNNMLDQFANDVYGRN